MRVFAILVGGEETPSARERVLKHVSALRMAGIDVRTHVAGDLRPGWLGKIQYVERLVREAALADVVLLHRVLPTEKELRLLVAANPRMVFDFDDALYAAQPGVAAAEPIESTRQKLQAVLRASRCVLAGNAVLAEYAARHARAVEVVPTCVDLERYAGRSDLLVATPASGSGDPSYRSFVLGWIGLGVNLPSLEAIAGPLREVCAERPGTVVKVISDRAPAMDGVPVRFAPWSGDTEVEELRGVDIGLMPLPDDEWSRGKCAWKALQYMALAIPPVVSPVGANREVVEDGVSGLWADTPEAWVRALSRLLDDEALRRRLGGAARGRVEERYGAPFALAALRGALERVARG